MSLHTNIKTGRNTVEISENGHSSLDSLDGHSSIHVDSLDHTVSVYLKVPDGCDLAILLNGRWIDVDLINEILDRSTQNRISNREFLRTREA